MKQVFEDMILIILLTMIAVVGSCMISANLEITQAREFHANAIERIQPLTLMSLLSMNLLQQHQINSQNGYSK